MKIFNYSAIRNQKWDSDILGLIAAIYKEAGKQELYLKQRPNELEKLVEIAKIQSTEASNAIEGIVTTSTRIKQLVEEKTTSRNRDEQEIAGVESSDLANQIKGGGLSGQNEILKDAETLVLKMLPLQDRGEGNLRLSEAIPEPSLRLPELSDGGTVWEAVQEQTDRNCFYGRKTERVLGRKI